MNLNVEDKVTVGVSRERIERSKLASLYAEGGKRATAYMRSIVEAGWKNNSPLFNEDVIRETNRRVLFYAHKDAKGAFRDRSDYSTEVDTEPALYGRFVPLRFRQFCEWLQSNMRYITVNTADLEAGLRIAAATHYGITGPQLHPFVDGNGRTARVVTNGILMFGTRELSEFGIAIPPVPILRSPVTEKGRIDPYVVALRNVHMTGTTNPLEKHIAEIWIINLNSRLTLIKSVLKKPTSSDIHLIEQFEKREETLRRFLDSENKRNNWPHLIPDYFASATPLFSV